MDRMKPKFAEISTDDFEKYLKKHNIESTSEELSSVPQSGPIPLESGITLSILETTGQRFGDASGETSAK